MKKKAFTLMELLVVIAIIALLLAILMPSLNRAREQARNVVCSSHLHSWGMVFALYGKDNDDKVCPVQMPEPNGRIMVSWVGTLKRYYTSDEIRLCPSAKKVLRNAEDWMGQKVGSKFGAWFVNGQDGSYGMNVYAQSFWVLPDGSLHNAYNTPPEQHWQKLFIKEAKEVPLILDCVWRELIPDYLTNYQDIPISREDAPFSERQWHFLNDSCGMINRSVINRHNKAVNGVFMDGGTKHILLPELWQYRWNRAWRPKYDVTIRWLK